MRVSAGNDVELQQFDRWQMEIGDGENVIGDKIMLPAANVFNIKQNTRNEPHNEDDHMKQFCVSIYPNLENQILNQEFLQNRSILAPTNVEVDKINTLLTSLLPETLNKLYSCDSFETNDYDRNLYSIEFLNRLKPSGYPEHTINLKKGMPLMLLRNLSPKEGLCNGTKLIYIENLRNKLLKCKIASTGREVLIPRIKFLPDSSHCPVEWSRIQFPIRVAFASTINKSQGNLILNIIATALLYSINWFTKKVIFSLNLVFENHIIMYFFKTIYYMQI